MKKLSEDFKEWVADSKKNNPLLTKSLYHFVCSLHLFIVLFPILIIFFTNNILYLSFAILLKFTIVLNWVIFGNCFFTDIENMLIDTETPEKSFISQLFVRFFGETISHYLIIFIPLIVVIIALYKINYAQKIVSV